ncbi:hypothetical protein L1987_80204 [Smallanthus sonchifolius]|uniref:Uncharacterized protein n=1 Tax=Smallanthus sonchifolius TaxID=185202 RepID=A0ACB8YM28_9ASTR|nr:hypothetical protein L1987_80204 [Smallanthus sonchifolius]
MAEEEALNDDILSPNTLIAWERIQLSSLPTQFQSQSPVIVLSDPHGGEGNWSTPPAHKQHQTSVEKDERINHLLHQIARMNELLLASHHGVPMISKATST